MISKIFIVQQILGMFPFIYTEQEFRVSYLLAEFCIIIKGYIGYMFYSYVRYMLLPQFDRNLSALYISNWIPIFNIFIVFTISSLETTLRITDLEKVIEMFMKIDTIFLKIGSNPLYNIKITNEIIVCFLAVVAYTLIVLNSPSFSKYFVYNTLLAIHFSLSVIPFIKMVKLVTNRIEILNRNLKNNKINRSGLLLAVRIVNAYNLICGKLNECYKYQIFGIVYVTFLNSVLLSYGFLWVLTSLCFYEKCFKSYLITLSIFILLYIVVLLEMIKNCDSVSDSKKLRLHIQMERRIIFTACDFFNIDFSLFHSMLAAATTYLVILLQLDVKPNPNKGPTTTAVNITTSSFNFTETNFTAPNLTSVNDP